MAASPYGFGFGSAERNAIGLDHVYVVELDSFYHRPSKRLKTARALTNQFAHSIPQCASRLLEWSRCPKVDSLAYLPGNHSLFAKEDDTWVLNTWTPSDLAPLDGACDRLNALIEHLFPHPEQRRYVLDMISYALQNRGAKVSQSLVVRGPQGSGKGIFAKVIAALFGALNSRKVEGHSLLGRFWDDLVDVEFLAVDEVAYGEQRETYNRVKTLITDEYGRYEQKGLPYSKRRHPSFIVVLTNRAVPFAIEDCDRRFFFPDFGQAPREQDFYAELNRAIPDELPAFLYALLHRDVSAFDPHAPAPMTGEKADVIENSLPHVERHLSELIRDRVGRFAADIVIPGEVAADLRQTGLNDASDSRVKQALRALGAAPCKNQLPTWPIRAAGRPYAGEPRVYAIRNHSQWLEASKATLKDHLVSFRSGRSVVDGPQLVHVA